MKLLNLYFPWNLLKKIYDIGYRTNNLSESKDHLYFLFQPGLVLLWGHCITVIPGLPYAIILVILFTCFLCWSLSSLVPLFSFLSLFPHFGGTPFLRKGACEVNLLRNFLPENIFILPLHLFGHLAENLSSRLKIIPILNLKVLHHYFLAFSVFVYKFNVILIPHDSYVSIVFSPEFWNLKIIFPGWGFSYLLCGAFSGPLNLKIYILQVYKIFLYCFISSLPPPQFLL